MSRRRSAPASVATSNRWFARSHGTDVTATTQPPTLEAQIAADFQGVQLDVTGNGPGPNGTMMFFQVGDWAAKRNRLATDQWCVSVRCGIDTLGMVVPSPPTG